MTLIPKNSPGPLLKKVSGTIGINAIEMGVGFFTAILLGRLIGVESYGVYSLAISIGGVFSIFCLLGHDQFSIRKVAALSAGSEQEKIQPYTRATIIKVLLLCMVISLAWLLALLWMRGAISEEKLITFLLVIPLLFLTVLKSLFAAYLQGLNRILESIYPDKIFRPVLFSTSILLLLATGTAFDARLALAFNLAACTVGVAFLWWLWGRYRPQVLSATRYSIKDGWREALPFIALAGVSVINQNIDVIMLGIWATDADVGFYRIASRMAALSTAVLLAINSVLAPQFTKLYLAGDMSKMQDLARKGVVFSFLFALSMMALFFGFGGRILELFGSGFVQGERALEILVVGQLIAAAVGSSSVILMMTNYAGRAVQTLYLATLTNILLNFFLISQYGASGAALASAISIAIVSLLNTFWVLKYFGVDTSIRGVFYFGKS